MYVGSLNSILISVRTINRSLSDALSQINQSAEQVSAGAEQVSTGAQSLAQGATEQASAVEELSATIADISENAKKTAVRQALSLKNADKAVIVESIATTGKTKEVAKKLNDLKLADKAVLMVVSEKAPEVLRATNNIPNLKLVRATYLNVFDVLNADAIIFSETALKATENWLLDKEEA